MKPIYVANERLGIFDKYFFAPRQNMILTTPLGKITRQKGEALATNLSARRKTHRQNQNPGRDPTVV
jgi:hypothetical protein